MPAATNTVAGNSQDSKNVTTTSDRNNKDQFRVQVQSQYLVSERPSILAPIEPKPPKDTSVEDIRGNKKGKKRGQNKKRPRDAKISSAHKACLQVIKGEECPFENCKYNHDLKEMMANRVDDLCDGDGGVEWLRGECPNWKLRG